MRAYAAVIIACLIAIAAVKAFVPSVQAAAPDVPPCKAINTLPDGSITVYRCEPDEGLPYLVNSNGFMMLEN